MYPLAVIQLSIAVRSECPLASLATELAQAESAVSIAEFVPALVEVVFELVLDVSAAKASEHAKKITEPIKAVA